MTISEIKSTARTKLKGSYIRSFFATLLYFIIISVLSIIEEITINNISIDILTTLIEAVFAIISLILGYGILANILDIVNIKTLAITDFINISIKNTTKIVKIMCSILIKIIIPIVIFLLSGFYLVGTSIANLHNKVFLCFHPNLVPLAVIIFIIAFLIFIYFLLKYILSQYIYHEDNNLSSKKIVNKSNKLMEKNKGKFILLILSFFPWLLGISIILYTLNHFIDAKYLSPLLIILYSMLKPYIVVSQSIFYEDCKDEAKYK